MDIKTTMDTYVAASYGRFPLSLVSGKGACLQDDCGNEYIDLGSGIAVNSFGASDEQWVAAVTAQLATLQHVSNLYYTEPCAKLAELLCTRTGMKKVFFSNSGAEANECAIKAARRWAFQKYGDESHATVITLKNSFHGRTMATLSATGQDHFHTEFGPFLPGFVYADPASPDELERLAAENACCAIMFEVVQGEGGVNPLSEEFVARMKAVAEKYDLLLICDEVQTGNGRTGQLYGYMNYDLSPDIVSTAKGLGGGLPIGATMLGERCEKVFTPGSHGSTFGGNPVCCAGALNVLSRIDDAMLAEIRAKSEYIISTLTGAKGVKFISGMGLMLGIESERPAGDVIKGCMERGVLVISAKTKVRLLPPLNITMQQLEKAVSILKEELAK
ncbi:MAG: acetylornithine/succinylornithine family transaminase [Ruminococcaceae bacterium]|nr:acetylornithine/succinylornithine family transaminase [Oscillospiraceae bacterium]